MKRWRLTIFPGIRFSGVSCSCIGRLVPGVSQPLFLSLSLMYQRLGRLATSGKRLQQLRDTYIYIYIYMIICVYVYMYIIQLYNMYTVRYITLGRWFTD